MSALMRGIRIVRLAIGAALGVQALVWLASGVALAWLPQDLARGEARAQIRFPAALEIRSYANPGGAIAQAPGATGLRLGNFLDRVVYFVESPQGGALIDARTGEKISPLSEKLARDVARRDFVGEAKIERMELLHDRPAGYDGPTPVWRASFDDSLHTQIYLSPATGEVTARRNRLSARQAFFRRLHLMDYAGEGSGETILKATGLAALAYLGLTALIFAAGRRAASS